MNRKQTFAAAAVLFLASAHNAAAADRTWTITPYAWATDIGIDVTVDDRKVVDEEISVMDLLEDVDTLAQVRIETQKGRLGFFVDLFDVNLSDDATTVPLPMGGGDATLTPEAGMTLLDLGAIYDPKGDHRGFQLLYGARILNQRATIDAEINPAGRATVDKQFEVDDTLVDALVGVRYIHPIGKRFSHEIEVDASTGGTELTWDAGQTFGYTFGKNGRYTAIAGYRYMVIDFDTEDSVDAQMTLSGFVAGMRIAF